MAGAAGFVGSHLCEALVDEGHEVVGMDNLITGNENNLAPVASSSRFEFLPQDITKSFQWKGPLHQIYNLASPASPPDYLAHPLETLEVGSVGVRHLLELARQTGARFLMASTSEVYGDPEVHPQPESYWGRVNSIGPRSVYDEAKRFAEATTMAYHRHHGVNTAIVRIFNTYGERMRPNDGRAIPNFIDEALGGRPLTVYGDGSQTRSFCYVSDMVSGLMKLMASGEHDPINIGNPTEMTVLELAKYINQLTGGKNQIVFKPLPQDDPKVRRPDITRAKNLLGWEPKVPFEEGLKRTLDWFQQQKRGSETKAR